MATTFHYFPLLPWELRSQTWQLTVEPRTVDVEIIRKEVEAPFTYYKQPIQAWLRGAPEKYQAGVLVALKSDHTLRLRSRTPVPGSLQACREARNLGLYKKEFSDVEVIPEGAERRYIWLNLDVNMIDVDDRGFPGYFSEDVASTIRRLKIRYEAEEWKNDFTNRLFRLCNCFDLREVHVVCQNGSYKWAVDQAFRHSWWPCRGDKVFFSEPGDDRIIPGKELEEGNRVDKVSGKLFKMPGAFGRTGRVVARILIPLLIRTPLAINVNNRSRQM